MIAEGDDLRGNRNIDLCSLQQSAEYGTHLLEAKRDFTAFFIPSIGHQDKMRGAHLGPCLLACKDIAGKEQATRKHQEEKSDRGSPGHKWDCSAVLARAGEY